MVSVIEASTWRGGGLIDMFADIWRLDPALAVIFVLAMIGFVSTTVLIVAKVVRGTVSTTQQVHTWLRDSGRLTASTAPTPDLGPEPPAVVNLLLTHGKLTRNAVRATVLDLAARGAVTLYQPGNDPADTIVMRTNDAAGDLHVYERRVLDELKANGERPRLVALPFLQPTGMRRWHRQFRHEVQADARARGLTFLDTSILSRSVAAGFVPCSVVGFIGGLGPIVIVLFIIATVVVGERSRVWLSKRGREALANWLGVRSWLRAHELFADLPPAAVAVWGRYLAYGAAMDVTRAD